MFTCSDFNAFMCDTQIGLCEKGIWKIKLTLRLTPFGKNDLRDLIMDLCVCGGLGNNCSDYRLTIGCKMPLIDPANWFRVSWKKKKKIIQTNTYIRDRRKEHQINDISPPLQSHQLHLWDPSRIRDLWRDEAPTGPDCVSHPCTASLHCIIIVHRSASKQYDGEEVHVKSGSSECTVTLYPYSAVHHQNALLQH